MLSFSDFRHLPQAAEMVGRLVRDGPGLVAVAGLDPRPLAALPSSVFLPSGRSTFFGILARELLLASPSASAVLIAGDRETVRLQGSLRRRVAYTAAKTPAEYVAALESLSQRPPAILILGELDPAVAAPALALARSGVRVLVQLDCVFVGAALARHLCYLSGDESLMDGLAWAVAVQRMPALCPRCRLETQLDPDRRSDLAHRHPNLPLDGPFYRLNGCDQCGHTGYAGEISAFDFLRCEAPLAEMFDQPSQLSLEEYLLHLAAGGIVPLHVALHLDEERLHRTYQLLTTSERALVSVNAELQRKVTELEASHRALEHRTSSLLALQSMSEALIGPSELGELARRLLRQISALCGADRAVLYVLRPDTQAEVLAVTGWERAYVGRKLAAMDVFGAATFDGQVARSLDSPAPYAGAPPGFAFRDPDVEGVALRAGLRAPLMAQNEVVRLLMVHSTQKDRFAPSETALLRAVANQAALAIQRAGLVEALRDKIAQLEAAQAELVHRERLARELELARAVQQSLLPQSFPVLPGYAFAARSEAARRVGGDFYDVFVLDDDRFGIAIADVSDKGMPAALFMTLTRSLLFAEARRETSPAQTLRNVHKLLLALGEPGMFVTVFYGVVDTRAHTLQYCRAGHEEPVLLRDGAAQPLGGQGTLLGLLDVEQTVLGEETLALQPGDCLALFTDGLVDALGPGETAFGHERLLSLLAAQSTRSAAELCAAVFDEVIAYQSGREQFDDMALLVMTLAQ